jgi:hypothetical protein
MLSNCDSIAQVIRKTSFTLFVLCITRTRVNAANMILPTHTVQSVQSHRFATCSNVFHTSRPFSHHPAPKLTSWGPPDARFDYSIADACSWVNPLPGMSNKSNTGFYRSATSSTPQTPRDTDEETIAVVARLGMRIEGS